MYRVPVSGFHRRPPCPPAPLSLTLPRVFEGATYTFEDDQFSYGEQRFVTLGALAGVSVWVVHTESQHEIRVISFRKSSKREAQIYFDAIQD